MTLSSVLRILGVLDMLDRKEQGTLRVTASETQPDGFDATFMSSVGGGARRAKTLGSRETLRRFLSGLGVPEEGHKRAMGEVQSRGSGLISGVVVSRTEMEENWPTNKKA